MSDQRLNRDPIVEDPARSASRTRWALAAAILLAGTTAFAAPAPLAAQTVHAVLFHSPTCPHCRRVIGEDLPIFFQVYGGEPRVTQASPYLALVTNGTLEMLFVDASQPAGLALYRESFVTHPVSEDRSGVPRLILGDSVLVGEVEIPGRLHTIIRAGLAAGGVPWPDIPGIAEAVATAEKAAGRIATAAAGPDSARGASPGQAPGAAGGAGSVEPPTGGSEAAGTSGRDSSAVPAVTRADTAAARLDEIVAQGDQGTMARFSRDPVGNGMAIVVLAVLIAVAAAASTGVAGRRGPTEPGLWIPALAVIGAAVAGYMTYVETSGARAVCGPVGDCNTVQQSSYAVVFGVPVGILGLLGYGLVLVLWVLGQEGRPAVRTVRCTLLAATMAGTLFSIYLTFLEPFVIGATCVWCLTSAVVMAALLWLAAAWPKHVSGQ